MFAALVIMDAIYVVILTTLKMAFYVLVGFTMAGYWMLIFCYWTVKIMWKVAVLLWKGGRYAWNSGFGRKGRGRSVLHHSDGGVTYRSV